MAFSCLINRLSTPVLKAQFIKNIGTPILKPNNAVYIAQTSYHKNLKANGLRLKEFFSLKNSVPKSCSLTHVSKQFSTSSVRLSEHSVLGHGMMWTFERTISLLLVPVIPAALSCPCKELDCMLALLVVFHGHFGLEAIAIDYVRPILFGNVIPKVAIGLVYVLSMVTIAGLFNIILNDAGLANTLITLWKK